MMKLFNTNNMQIYSRQIANRRDKFIKSGSQRINLLTFINMQIILLVEYMPFVRACVFLFSLLLVKLFSIVYLYNVATIYGE